MSTDTQTETKATPTKEQLLAALAAFISQRSGIDARNYAGDREAFLGDYRPILQAGRDARQLLRSIELRDSITAQDILEAAKSAYSGRLSFQIKERDGQTWVGVDYCTGQYFPTEYRRAACAVLASVFWAWIREKCMPKPGFVVAGKRIFDTMEEAQAHANTYLPSIVSIEERYRGMSAGDFIRHTAKREFGRGLASRWFN